MRTIKAKRFGNELKYKSVNRVLAVITELKKQDGYSVDGLELKTGEKYFELYTPICRGSGFGSNYKTFEEAKERAERYINGCLFGDVNILYV